MENVKQTDLELKTMGFLLSSRTKWPLYCTASAGADRVFNGYRMTHKSLSQELKRLALRSHFAGLVLGLFLFSFKSILNNGQSRHFR